MKRERKRTASSRVVHLRVNGVDSTFTNASFRTAETERKAKHARCKGLRRVRNIPTADPTETT